MIEVKNLSKTFKLYSKPSDRLKEKFFRKTFHKIHPALKDISFRVEDGETLGIIGQNGAGKSTLLKILMNVTMPDEGKIYTSGKITGLLELGTGFNPEMTGLKNIYMNGMLLNMSKEEIDNKKNKIIEFSELGDFINEPIKTYSSGMVMRLAFSVAIHADPQCFLVDEALSVGDAHFQQKCMKKIREFKESGGSIIFVSHDMNSVKMLCDKAILLEHGEVLDYGTPESVVNQYNFLISKMSDTKGKMILKNMEKKKEYGSYEAEISSVEIIGKDSKSNVVSSGENAKIEIVIKSFENIKDVALGIMFRDKYGQDIYGTNTNPYHLNKKLSFQKDTLNKYAFYVDMNLAPGKYTVTVAIHSEYTHIDKCYHWVDNWSDFEIVGFKDKMFAGITDLKATFEMEKDS